LPEPRYGDTSPATNHFFEQVLDNIAQSPGVVSTGTTTIVPPQPSQLMTRFFIEGAPPLAPGSFPWHRSVTSARLFKRWALAFVRAECSRPTTSRAT
jgi:hypothetical protein